MVCDKCGYLDKKEVGVSGRKLCSLCAFFSPIDKQDLRDYIEEKLDWKILETFRKYGQKIGNRQKVGMEIKAREGKIMSRVAFGYSLIDEKLVENENASQVHALFKEYLETEISLNKLSKRSGLSLNGLKKILKNRTYLGEIKFNGQIYKSGHKSIISPEIFYAVQRKLKERGRTQNSHGKKSSSSPEI
jgi:hypothetical protein